jgi:hypothetical protein
MEERALGGWMMGQEGVSCDYVVGGGWMVAGGSVKHWSEHVDTHKDSCGLTYLDDEDAEERKRDRLEPDVGFRGQRRVLEVLLDDDKEAHQDEGPRGDGVVQPDQQLQPAAAPGGGRAGGGGGGGGGGAAEGGGGGGGAGGGAAGRLAAGAACTVGGWFWLIVEQLQNKTGESD